MTRIYTHPVITDDFRFFKACATDCVCVCVSLYRRVGAVVCGGLDQIFR